MYLQTDGICWGQIGKSLRANLKRGVGGDYNLYGGENMRKLI